MAGLMWFGTREYMTWIAAPATGRDSSKFDWNQQTNYLNGGSFIKRSQSSHKEYQMSWNQTTRDKMRIITDFADGVYGTGAIYWADPMTMDKNMCPQSWATPSLGANDGLILSGSTTRPTLVATSANSLALPSYTAQYTVGADTKPVLWLPIPVGYTAWVGVYGSAGTGGTVVATPTTGVSSLGTPHTMTLLATTNNARFNYSVDSSSGANTGVQLNLSGTGTINITGIMVQVLPTGTSPQAGPFISGQGHSGCQFASQPTVVDYSLPLDQIGVTAKLVETTQWQ